jgi:hypothetical protein
MEVAMRKVVVPIVWTLFLAIPLTALALSLAAFLTDHLGDFATWMVALSQATTVGGRGWITEFSERMPEVAGMIIGQVVILTILLIARRSRLNGENNSH